MPAVLKKKKRKDTSTNKFHSYNLKHTQDYINRAAMLTPHQTMMCFAYQFSFISSVNLTSFVSYCHHTDLNTANINIQNINIKKSNSTDNKVV